MMDGFPGVFRELPGAAGVGCGEGSAVSNWQPPPEEASLFPAGVWDTTGTLNLHKSLILLTRRSRQGHNLSTL